MNLALAIVAAMAAANPFRLGAALPSRDRWPIALLAGLGTVGALAIVAAVAGPLLGALAITVPTARIGAGTALILTGAGTALAGPPHAQPSLPGRWAALVPVMFPILAGPGLTLLVLAVAAERGMATALVVAAAALAPTLAAGAALPPAPMTAALSTPPSPLSSAGRRAVATLGAAAGVAVTMSGVLDI